MTKFGEVKVIASPVTSTSITSYITSPSVKSQMTSSTSRGQLISAGDRVVRRYRRAMTRRAEYAKLKAIVPAVSRVKSASKLTVIEEAINYINELHAALSSRLITCDTSTNNDFDSADSLRNQSTSGSPPSSLPPHLFLQQLFQQTSMASIKNRLGSNEHPSRDVTDVSSSRLRLHHQSVMSPSSYPDALFSRSRVVGSFPNLPVQRQVRKPLADIKPLANIE